MAIERFNSCENIVALANELGIQRTLLYKWRQKFEADVSQCKSAKDSARQCELRKLHENDQEIFSFSKSRGPYNHSNFW